MPIMANITVKNTANVDVIYVAKTPSSGDKTSAVWTLDAASVVIGLRPKLQVRTRNNGSSNGRVVELSLSTPIIQTIDGVPTKAATAVWDIRGVIPTNVSSVDVYEAAFQLGNLISSTLCRSVFSDGYAPT